MTLFPSVGFAEDVRAGAIVAILQPQGELVAALRMAEQKDGRSLGP